MEQIDLVVFPVYFLRPGQMFLRQHDSTLTHKLEEKLDYMSTVYQHRFYKSRKITLD
jgi:hypothetical protein